MALLTREQILGADDLPTEDVDVPEWGGTVRLRTLTGTERDAFEASSVQQAGKVRRININNIRARLVALCIVGEDGNRMFSDTDIKALGAKSSKALDRVFDAASKMNGLSDEDVEKLAEGFGDAQSESATTA